MTLTNFIRYLRTEKRYSPHSLRAYESDLQQLSSFLNDSFSLENPAEASEKMLRQWISSLKQKGLDSSSINRKQSAARAFFNFLLSNGQIQKHPMERMKSLRQKKRVASFIPVGQMEALQLQQTEERYSDLLRNVVIEMFYQTGLRISELYGLTLSDIDLTGMQIKIRGKGNKERYIPFHTNLLSHLLKYFTARDQLESDSDCFIILENGKQPNIKWIYTLVNKELKQVSTLSKTSPHVLRHTFATHMLNNGANLLAVKELLGHSSLAATQVYTHNTIEQLKQIYQQAHPKGN